VGGFNSAYPVKAAIGGTISDGYQDVLKQEPRAAEAAAGAMQNDVEPIFQRTCALLQPFNPRGIEISPDTDITGDLEIDSVAVLDLIMEVEDEYGISLPMNLISEIRTVGDLVRAIHQIAGAK